MRVVVAVLLFVAMVHAAAWGVLQQKQSAPDFRGILPSASYTPFEPGHTVADGEGNAAALPAVDAVGAWVAAAAWGGWAPGLIQQA